MKPDKFVIVVAGPTAVGKTGTAIRLAQSLGTEVISADSRQVYREMTVGTAKPDAVELAVVPHHFIDTRSIRDTYSAAQYAEDALSAITQLHIRHDFVVLCGGSGLYIKAVCEGFDDIPPIDEDVRTRIRSAYEQKGIEWLQEQLSLKDSGYFETVDKQNPHRLMRGLEVIESTGLSIQSFHSSSKASRDFTTIKIGLELPREQLYERIDSRMDRMIANGLFEEAASLYPHRHHLALQTVGYQEIFGYMDGLYNKAEAIRLLKRNSRRYAKRQLTWFRKDEAFKWFAPSGHQEILEYIARSTQGHERY